MKDASKQGKNEGRGRRKAKLSRLGLGLACILGLATCSDGCAHDLPVQTAAQLQRMELDELQALLWPDGDGQYKLMTEAELAALERLVALLYSRAESGHLVGAQGMRVAADAAKAGVELYDVELVHEGQVLRLWLVVEAAGDRRGRGSYLIRLGAAEPGGEFEHVLHAPHSRYDEYSGEIALGMFVERGLGVPLARALLLNSVHRHMQSNGAREIRKPPRSNPADAAHRVDHPLARVTARLLEDHSIALVQLHGFERQKDTDEPDVIISAGEDRARPASMAVVERLSASLSETPVLHYGDQGAMRLGGTLNVQGQAARDAQRCFVHVETSALLRARLRSERELRRQFAAAILGGSAEEFRDGCS